MARKKLDEDYDSIVDFPGSRRIYRGKGGETQPKKGRGGGAWLGANAAPEDAIKGKGLDPEEVIKSRDKDVIGAPSAPIDTKGLPKLENERKTPVKKFEGEPTRTVIPRKAESAKPDSKKKKAKKAEVKKTIRFAEDGGIESGLLTENMSVPKDPEPTRTGGNRGVTGTPERGELPPESSAAKPLIGRSNRNAPARQAQADILATGTADEYWKHAIGTERLDKSTNTVVVDKAAGMFTDLGATRDGKPAGGFCTNCDTSIPGPEAAIPLPRKGPGGITRFAQSASGRQGSYGTPSEDTLCATCTPVASSVTSSGQQALAEKFNVQRPRG
jgi:hypothetical protein